MTSGLFGLACDVAVLEGALCLVVGERSSGQSVLKSEG